MLVLTRKVDEVVIIGDEELRIQVLSTARGVVKLGFDAPKNIAINREEIFQKIKKLEKDENDKKDLH